MRVSIFALLAGAMVLTAALSSQAQDGPNKKEIEKKKGIERVNGRTLFEWSDLAKSKDPSEAELAIATLKVYGRDAQREAPVVIKAFSSKDISLRVNAAITIGFIGLSPEHKDEGINGLRRLLRDTQGIVRFQAIRALGRLGPIAFDAVAELCSAANDTWSWEIRGAAAAALGNVAWDSNGYNRAAWSACLRAAQNDVCSEVRLQAVLALILFGKPGKIDEVRREEQILQALTSEKQKKVAVWAHVGLMRLDEKMADRASEHHLTAISKYLKSKDFQCRMHAARALAVIGPYAKTQVPPLTDALSDKDNDAFVLIWVITALSNMKDDAKEALPALDRLKSHSDPTIREMATRAIEEIKIKQRRDDMPDKKKK
jgi:HEAT repeat protein